MYPKIFIQYNELDHTGTLSFILPIGQISFFHFFFDLFFQDIAVVIFYRLIKKISSFNHFVIDKIVPNDNLNSSFIDKKVLDFFSPLKQIFFHLLSGNILLIQNIRQNRLKIDIAKIINHYPFDRI